jgi:hypothetical protein
MPKRGSRKGSIDQTFSYSGKTSPKYSQIEQSLRRNGIAVMRKGNRDKLTIARDKKQVVVYGNMIYSPVRDKGETSGDPFIDGIVDKIKAEAQKMKEIEWSGVTNHGGNKSHHSRNEPTTGHHKKKGWFL